MLAPRILIQEKDSVQLPGKIPAQLKQTLIYGLFFPPQVSTELEMVVNLAYSAIPQIMRKR